MNGERVVASTAVRCAVLCGYDDPRELGAPRQPVHVVAVGDPARLEKALFSDGTTRTCSRHAVRYKLRVNLDKRLSVMVPTYRGTMRPTYARSLKEDGIS